MLQSHLKFFKIACSICEHSCGILFQWDPTQRKLYLKKDLPSKRKTLDILINLQVFFFFILVLDGYQQFYVQSATQLSKNDGFVFAVAVLCLLTAHPFVRACKANASSICIYINSVLALPNKHSAFKLNFKRQKSSFLDKLNIVVAYSSFTHAFLMPILLVFGIHWQNPCKPSIAGYWMLPQCSNTSSWYHVKFLGSWYLRATLKTLLLTANYMLSAFSYHTTGFSYSCIMVLPTISMRKYIEM